jgi:hypothetical protein
MAAMKGFLIRLGKFMTDTPSQGCPVDVAVR